MKVLKVAVPALLLLLFVAATPTKPAAVAPPAIPHPIALFLSDLSRQGKRQVTFKASAVGTHFFFEEQSGVTVYRFVNGQYVKESFLAGAKLPVAMKRFAKL
jgi:hypothetical protein